MKKRGVLCLLLLLALLLPSAAHGSDEIRVGFNYNVKPYHFVDAEGQNRGLHIDVLNAIARDKQLSLLYVPYRTNSECLAALEAGEIDVVLGHRASDSSVVDLQCTSELSTSALCLYAKSEFEDEMKRSRGNRPYTVVMEYGSATAYLAKMGIHRYIAVGSQDDVIDTLLSGKVEMALADRDCCNYAMNEMEIAQDYAIVRDYIVPVSYTMLLRRNDTDLFRILNSGLMDLRADGNYEDIYRRWIHTDNSDYNELVRKITMWLGLAAVITAMVIIFISAMNRILKRRVNEKTRELYAANVELDKRMARIESEGQLRANLIEAAPNGMVSFDHNYSILLMNRAALRIARIGEYGPAQDIRSLPVFADILAAAGDIFARAAKSVSHPNMIELALPGGGSASYRYIFYRLRGKDNADHCLLSVEDVTREEREKQALFEQEKTASLNRLVAGIAHEIKNPLMAIRTASSLLQTQWDDPDVQHAFVEFVPQEVDRINRLIESLIHYAKPAKGEKRRVDMAQLVQECLYLTQVEAKRSKIALRVQIDENAQIYADRDRIKQSVVNIIMNGLESIEKKHKQQPNALLHMDITLRAAGDAVEIGIRDEGVGMAQDVIQRCTEPFFTTKVAGTGIGLALVKQYVGENGGELQIESVAGKYTSILLKFRRYADEAQNIDC